MNQQKTLAANSLKIPLLLDNVTIKFGGETILENISLNILKGDTIVLIGPSGGGKTVLLKTMAGLYEPSQGRVYCEGENLKNMNGQDKRKLARKIGVQFQKSALFDSLTVAENVAFPIREHIPEMSEKKIQERIDFCLDSVNLLKAKYQMPHELSGGMRIRLGIARAISLEPEIIFYDDPTAGLDPVNSDKMAQLILDLQIKNKSTVIAITHDILRAFQLAGRTILVANKSIVETGSAEETKKHSDPRVQQFIKGELNGPLEWG